MMKEISIPKIDQHQVNVMDVARLFQENGVTYHAVDQVDWEKEYPYRPDVTFALAQTDDAILVHYKVSEDCVRAVAPHDNGHVWEDSCCELFIQPENDGTYYNIECNCAGTLLIGYGKDRNGRELAPQSVLDRVQRSSSLGRAPFESKSGHFDWDMALVIPMTAFFKHDVATLAGKTVKGNVYKCGDMTDTPHFVSWNRIDVPSPDFHLQEFFGTMKF